MLVVSGLLAAAVIVGIEAVLGGAHGVRVAGPPSRRHRERGPGIHDPAHAADDRHDPARLADVRRDPAGLADAWHDPAGPARPRRNDPPVPSTP